jgi:dTDP-4-amino-4,6-dideoxygalactose transaminase
MPAAGYQRKMADRIPLIEPVVGEEELENVRQVLESGYMTQGPFAQEFEAGFESLTGADFAVTATSCTTGMEMALEGLGVGAGDEVIIPDFTHPATGNAVVRLGAEPVLVDVERDTYNIDAGAVRDAITDETAAILPVSWGGQPLDPDLLREIATDHDLVIVEDAACSAGAAYDGQPVGSQFDASVFSFHPRKVLTTGEGGLVTTDDADLEDTMRRIKNFGTNPRTDIDFVRADATNFRLSDVLAAIGVAQLEKRESVIERRKELAHRYTDLLQEVDAIREPHEPDAATHTYQTYAVYVEAGGDEARDEIIEQLAEDNIETQIGTFALHRTPAFRDSTRSGPLSVSTSLERNLLALPIAHSMTGADQERVVDRLDEAIGVYR